jgi:cytochrome c peroxidase
MKPRGWWKAGAVLALACLLAGSLVYVLTRGSNPNPVRLIRPAEAPLSALAQLGREIFSDASLSSSGRLACASCHRPDRAYGPPGDAPAMLGGPDLQRQGVRAVPSLMYLERQPNFSVGPDNEEDESVSLSDMAASALYAPRAQKTAASTEAAAANLVPQGGLFWDGRVDTLQDQALYPLLSPFEMDGGSAATVTGKFRLAPYAARFTQLFGEAIFENPDMLEAEAMSAVARYQFEEPSFHPYSSKFDAWLEGKARFSPAELRGYRLFNDPARANCAGCHPDKPGADGKPPLFTDHQYEALGVPRNAALVVNRQQGHFDLGICGPYRTDMAEQTQYCGMFITPTLRNVATRQVFFHNGVYHTLKQVMDFYNFRDTDRGKIYPRGADGLVETFNDIPTRFRANVDVTDPPFDRHAGDAPVLSEDDEDDIIAFLRTLTDGYIAAR